MTDLTRRDTSLATLTAAWLWSFRESAHTREAYRRDVADFVAWCAGRDLDVTQARRVHLDAYAAALAHAPTPRTGRPLAPASIARRLAALSSWYGYLLDAGVVAQNPAQRVRRPRLDRDYTATVGLSTDEAVAVRRAAATDPVLGGACGAALAGFLVEIGARVSEVCALDVTDLGHDSGHRTVRLRMKGGKARTRAVPPGLAEVLAAYLAGRTDGPLFQGPEGRRLDRHGVYRFVRRRPDHPALVPARVGDHRPGTGGVAGGAPVRPRARRPAHHPALRPGPGPPGARPGLPGRGGGDRVIGRAAGRCRPPRSPGGSVPPAAPRTR